MSLSTERCEVCRPGMPHLEDDEAQRLLTEVGPEWEIVGETRRLRRTVSTDDFGSSMALAVRIGFVAEAEGHHPDLHVHWSRLVIDITTHAAGGLTRNDFILAAKVDDLLR